MATTTTDFGDQARRLQGVPAPARQAIERAQPFSVGGARAESDALAILTRMSNIDKHRSLTTVTTAVPPATLGHSGRVKIEDWKHGTARALGPGRTAVGSFTARSNQPLVQTDLEPMYGYDVHLEGPPFGVIGNFVRRVHESLWGIETGKPLEPWMPYPVWVADRFVWSNS